MRRERAPARRLRRWLLLLAALILLCGAAYIALDLTSHSIAQNQVARAIAKRTRAHAVTVRVDSIPFLYDIVVSSTLPVVDVRLIDVPIGRLDVGHLDVSARNVHFDRHVLFDDHRLRVTAISSATVQATVTAAELSKAIGHEVVLVGPDTIKVRIGPLLVPAQLGIVGGHVLTIDEAGFRLLGVDLASISVVPPCAMRLTVGPGVAMLQCRIAPVPTSLFAAISSNT